MTSQTRRERLQLGQLTLTANAQGHRLSAAERTARPGVAPPASRAAPQAHAASPLKTARNACEVIIVPNRIASLRLIAPSVSLLFDELIRPQHHRLRDRQAERLRRLPVEPTHGRERTRPDAFVRRYGGARGIVDPPHRPWGSGVRTWTACSRRVGHDSTTN